VAGSVQSDSITGSTITMKNTGSTIVASDGTTAVLSESGGTVTIDADVSTIGSATISGGSITETEIDLKSSGTTIFASDGTTAVLSESGGVVTLTADEANVGSNALVVDSNGNVGIGINNPSSNVEVSQSDTNSTTTLKISNAGSTGLGGAKLSFGHSPNNEIGYIKNNYENYVSGFNWTMTLASQAQFRFVTNIVGTPTERMRIDGNGYLLVGYTSSNGSYKLQVNSQIYATSSTIAVSDFNYKENITPLDGALSLVSQLNPVQFDWKEHPVHEFDRNQPTVGFIAQEVQQVLSDQSYVNSIVKSNECIIEPEEIDEEGNVIKEAVIEEFLGIAEGNMIALLTKAIKEQQVIIDALTARIEALETP